MKSCPSHRRRCGSLNSSTERRSLPLTSRLPTNASTSLRSTPSGRHRRLVLEHQMSAAISSSSQLPPAAGGFLHGQQNLGFLLLLLLGVSDDSNVEPGHSPSTAIAESSGEMPGAAGVVAAASGFEGAFTAANLCCAIKDGVQSRNGRRSLDPYQSGRIVQSIAYTYQQPEWLANRRIPRGDRKSPQLIKI